MNSCSALVPKFFAFLNTTSGVTMIQAIETTSPSIRKRPRADAAPATDRRQAVVESPALSRGSRGQQRNLQQLKVVREHIEDLILLSDRRLCQEFVGGLTDAESARYKAESKRLVAKVRQVIGTARLEASARDLDRVANRPLSKHPQNTQVQVQMSSALVRILEAFGNAGKRPGKLIERALWNDRDIQNAALLLRINMPQSITPQDQR